MTQPCVKIACLFLQCISFATTPYLRLYSDSQSTILVVYLATKLLTSSLGHISYKNGQTLPESHSDSVFYVKSD